MENTKRNIPWGIIGLTLGAAAVGVGLGILYAPKKGEETRTDVKNWLVAKRDMTRNLFAKSKQTLVEKRDMIANAIKARRHNRVNEKELIAA